VSVTLVLDTSAILAYAKGSIAVGELISIIADDGDTALVPATCLAEAYRVLPGSESQLLGVLASVSSVGLAPLGGDQAVDVGTSAHDIGIDLAHAAAEAIAHDAQLATQHRVVLDRLLPPDWPILDV